MNLIRAVLKYERRSMLHWVTFDTVSGQMIDCSIHPTHKERAQYQSKRYEIVRGKIGISCPVEAYQERKFESLTEIKIGEDNYVR